MNMLRALRATGWCGTALTPRSWHTDDRRMCKEPADDGGDKQPPADSGPLLKVFFTPRSAHALAMNPITHTYTHTHKQTHTHTDICTYKHTYICTYIQTYIHR